MKLVPGFWSCHAACWHQVIFILLGNIYDSTPFQLICMLSMIWMFCSLVENLCFVLNSFQKFQVGCCLCLAGQQLVHGEMFSSGCSSTPPGRFDNAENRLHITPYSFLWGPRGTLREYRTYSGSWDDLQVCKVFGEFGPDLCCIQSCGKAHSAVVDPVLTLGFLPWKDRRLCLWQ